MTADLQVGEDSTSPAYRRSLESVVGDRAARLLPVRELFDGGAHVTLSSDWDADALSPFGIIERAVSRDRQAIADVATAVSMLTVRPAEVVGHEATVGCIALGYRADLVVADTDIFSVLVAQIGRTRST